MTLFAKVVDVNNGDFFLTYDTYEYVTDGFERITQRFDASTGKREKPRENSFPAGLKGNGSRI